LRITAGSSSPSVRGKREFERARGLIEGLGQRCAGSGRIDVTLVGERRMAALNREYRGRRGAAEILTFVYGGDPRPAGEGPAGEILICWKKLEESAARLGVSRRAYLLRLVAHGLSHVEGFTHGEDAQALRMEAREREMLDGVVGERYIGRMFS